MYEHTYMYDFEESVPAGSSDPPPHDVYIYMYSYVFTYIHV